MCIRDRPTAILPTDTIQPVTVTVETVNEVVQISMEADPEKIQIKKSPKTIEVIEPLAVTGNELAIEDISRKGEFKMAEVIEFEDLEEEQPEEPEYDDSQRELRMPETIISPKPLAKKHKSAYSRSHKRQSELELLLELALNHENLKEDVFVKDRNDELHQLVVITNGHFDDKANVSFADKKVIMVPSLHMEGYQVVEEYVDIQKFEISWNKCHIKSVSYTHLTLPTTPYV